MMMNIKYKNFRFGKYFSIRLDVLSRIKVFVQHYFLGKKYSAGFTRTPKNWVSGFTLVEMLVAVALFTVIASISIGAVVTIFDANRRSQSSKTVVDNLNFTIENMTRTVRFGNNYHCGSSGTLSSPNNCSSGGDSLAVTFNGGIVFYARCDGAIKMSQNGDTSCGDSDMEAITSSDTVIEYLRFYVLGAGTSGGNERYQPLVVAVIKGYVGNKPSAQSSFSIQTVMSQRRLDI